MPANEIIEDVVGGTVSAAEEHIVIVHDVVCNSCRCAEAEKDSKRYGNVSLFHADHSRDGDIERSEAGKGMR